MNVAELGAIQKIGYFEEKLVTEFRKVRKFKSRRIQAGKLIA